MQKYFSLSLHRLVSISGILSTSKCSLIIYLVLTISFGRETERIESTGKPVKSERDRQNQTIIRIYYLYNLLEIINLVSLWCLTVKEKSQEIIYMPKISSALMKANFLQPRKDHNYVHSRE